MKKLFALALAAMLLLSMAACDPAAPKDDPAVKSEGVMTYAQYAAAELESVVTIEAYVQATQNWWSDNGQGKITVYTQDMDGAYFLYEMPCTEAEAAKLVKGTKIRVTGVKTAWSGEVEIIDISKFEILDGSYIAQPQDLTSILANETELIKKQNVLATFKGLTVESISYKNGKPGPNNDIYVSFTLGEESFDFCVESYLTGPDSDVYKAFTDETIKVGDKVDVEGFVYWYNGVNTHITSIKKV